MRRDAKQEAEELVHLFDNHVIYWDCHNDEPLEENHSINCAIIAQQRIINEAEFWHNTNSYEETTDFLAGEERVNYQREIMKELEKL